MALNATQTARYQKLYTHYDSLLDKLLAAQSALVDGGVKSYTIDDRTLTRFDLDKLSAEIDSVVNKLSEIESVLDGGSKRKAVGVIPRDT